MTFNFRWLILASSLSVAACGSNNGTGKTGTTPAADPSGYAVQTSAGGAQSTPLVAAVEPFEALAETAFTATAADLDKSIAAAQAAAASIGTLVPTDVAARLQSIMARIAAARKSDQRADIAIASIEGFREVVAAGPKTSAIPADVSLLDYTGIRYDSDVQAMPRRWDDMTMAIAYGRERVAALSSLAPATKLLPKVNAAFAEMEKAVRLKDVKAARAAAKTQLDLVDELELAFAPRVKAL